MSRSPYLPPAELTVSRIAQCLKWPAYAWETHCYEVACEIVKAKLVVGRAVYGHYTGPVTKSIHWNPQRPFQRHGWIVVPIDSLTAIDAPDGVTSAVLDPTRWSFEHVRPYLWCGLPGEQYDEGGNGWVRACLRPPPARPEKNEKTFALCLTKKAGTVVASLLEERVVINVDPRVGKRVMTLELSLEQLCWIANLPYEYLGPHNQQVYKALHDMGKKALIPIDNWTRATLEA